MISDASNIKTETNPLYTLADNFYVMYPQFANDKYIIPEVVAQMYLNLADACIKQARWKSYWEMAMGLFIAHFCTLYLQGTADPNSGAAAVLKAGQTRGLETSVSVGDVSVSTDYTLIANSIEGWAQWKLTNYGTQLAGIGKLLGKGGIYIR